MIDTAIKIEDHDWPQWFAALNYVHEFGGIECDAGLFEQAEFLSQLKAGGIHCTHARNLIPDDVPGILDTAQRNHAVPQLYERLYAAMDTACSVGDVQSFSMPFRLDRIPKEEEDAELRRLATFVSRLLFAPVNHAFNLLVPVRLPRPFPSSEEISRAVRLCATARETPADSNINGDWVPSDKRSAFKNGIPSICLHIYPDEGILPDFNSLDLHLLQPFLGMLCFHYNVNAGETLFDDEQEQWATRLKEHGFPGTVVFCPDQCPPEAIDSVVTAARTWSNFYLPDPTQE
ncbi:MAG: hypothetical protein IJJ26_00185 [Victivallales bacterium]|nr:hypothetical protein [Victivallales bacterium]